MLGRMGDFEDLLHQVNAAHVLALQQLEWRNKVLVAEVADLHRAQSKDRDLDEGSRALPELLVEPRHFSPQHLPISPRQDSKEGSSGSIHSNMGASEGTGSPSRKVVDSIWSGFRRMSEGSGSPFRRLTPGIRDPGKVQRGSENLLAAVSGLQKSVTASIGPRALRNCLSKGNFAARAKKFVNSFTFDAVCALVITLNAIIVGVEVHALAKQRPAPEYSRIFDIAVVIWYSFELVLRLWADRWRQNLGWNFFDFLMLSAGLIDLSSDMEHGPGNYTIVRFLRYVRVLRVFKMLKIGKTVNNYFIVFSKMTYCLLQSLPSLVSAATVVLISTYISSVVITQLATDQRESQPLQVEGTTLVQHYGSLDVTFYSLVKSIFNGQAWGELMHPLSITSSMASVVFLMYLMSTLLCLLNVIHGVFVDSTLQSTAHYKELMVAQAQQRKLMLMQHLRETFHEIDTDNSGYITVQEFDACLKTAGGRAFFEFLGLSTVEAYELFRLMDADASQTVDIDEFCKGCMQFMGEAKNFDIQCIIAENRQTLQRWNVFIDNFEQCIHTCLCAWHSAAHGEGGKQSRHSREYDRFHRGSSAASVSNLLRGESNLFRGESIDFQPLPSISIPEEQSKAKAVGRKAFNDGCLLAGRSPLEIGEGVGEQPAIPSSNMPLSNLTTGQMKPLGRKNMLL